MNSLIEGWVCVFIAFLSFGLLSVPIKVKPVDPMLLQFFMSKVIVLFSCVILIFEPLKFSWYGVLGAALWVPVSCLSIFCVQLIGLSLAQSLWSGGTMIISFFYGVFLFQEKVGDILWITIGIIFLFLGVIIIPLSDFRIKKKKKSEEVENLLSQPTIQNGEVEEERFNIKNFILGLFLTFIMAILNATSMLPAKLDSGNMLYIFSFGTSQYLIGSTIIFIYFIIKAVIKRKFVLERKKIIGVIPTSIIFGVLWSIGYYAQMLVTFSPLGLTIGIPVIQTCLILSSICGMIFFKEIPGIIRKIIFFSGLIIMLIGFFIVGIFSKKN
jgi:glucose uptake protein GlcU